MKATSNWAEMHARFRPDAEAILDVDRDVRLTWRQVYDGSLRWAAWLRRRGVRAGDRVAVLSHNRADTLLLLFACAELGAILFPMNWRLSPEELSWQLGHCEPAVLLVDESHRDAVRHERHALDDGPGDERTDGPGSELSAPWQLMYTSGSTGRPKGALLTHAQLHWNALNTVLACDLTPDDATLTFTPLFHTGGMNSLTTPLLHRGGRVVLTKGVDVPQALKLIPQERVSLLMGVPTIFQMLADHPDFAAADLTSVRDALCGGQALPLPLLERYLARGIPLRQGFGMTEVGPNCFSMPHARVREKLGTVGMPIHHVAARVVRADGAPCGVDEAGELCFKGPAVFGGYFRDPEATARCLDADGWFHTGDVLSIDADGFFSVRGRIKEMYKSGGENVYPAEVEAAIQEHEAVAHAAVIGVPDERWGEVGHAFVEPRPGSEVDAAALLAFLQGRLARFKQPKQVTVMTALPRTASGKIDKVALKAGPA
ncbi:MAG: long-chain fatty acid--CoA ligase [Alphaproteobacteria bacterium]|nr:long-chain fatty acid--CoA ligase [Alphaproteobacteria bacterium]MCB9695850.1 long-chain fatty acid--CoA ligase [Alphaproteobacteria bacterium]